MPRLPDIFIGLMSGTSLDGADAVACRFEDNHAQFLGHAHLPYPTSLRNQLLSLLTTGEDEINRCGHAGIQLAYFYASVVEKLLQQTCLNRKEIRAIGVHGQTIRHCPQAGFTFQLNNPALLAELSGIDIIADFAAETWPLAAKALRLFLLFMPASFQVKTLEPSSTLVALPMSLF